MKLQMWILAFPLVFLHAVYAQTGEGNWKVVQSFPSIYEATFGNGLFLAVGDAGTLLTSSDGVRWTRRASKTHEVLTSAAFGGGRFVVVGANGTILVSQDGITWARASSGTDLDLIGVAYGNGQFVAVGENAIILTSPDGRKWTASTPLDIDREFSGKETFGLTGVAYGKGQFVAVGVAYEYTYENEALERLASDPRFSLFRHVYGTRKEAYFVAVSKGARWTWYPVDAKVIKIAYGNGRFVAVGNGIYTSQDGYRWTNTLSSDDEYIASITYGNGKFIASSGKSVFISSDGINWKSYTMFQIMSVMSEERTRASRTPMTIDPTWLGKGITFHNAPKPVASPNRFVLVGNQFSLVSGDGVTWSKHFRGFGGDFHAVAYGGGKFVTIGKDWEMGQGLIAYVSQDGNAWNQKTLGWADDPVPTSIAYGDGRFVALGANYVLTSSDGLAWTRRSIGFGEREREKFFRAEVGFGRGLFVAAFSGSGGGAILTSRDGRAWHRSFEAEYFVNSLLEKKIQKLSRIGLNLPTLPISFNHVTFGNGRFVIVGEDNAFVSTDGRVWKPSLTSELSDLKKVAYGDGRFVAVGSEGVVAVSSDGLIWRKTTVGALDNLASVSYGNGRFVAVSERGTIFSSRDGFRWVKEATPIRMGLNHISFGGGRFVVVGSNGTILLGQ